MEEKIRVIYKEPGKPAEVREIPNTLEALQEAVGGYIETLTFATDCAAIVNEEGKLRGLPANFCFLGEVLVGNVLFVGVDGEDFCSLKEQAALFLMGMMGGVYWVERGERQNA